jgi:adenylate kinase
MLVALSGTPGTGKTSLLRAFREAVPGDGQNYLSVELNSFVREQGLIIGEDPLRGSQEVDVSRLAEVFREKVLQGKDGKLPSLVLVEGHLSHLLKPDLCLLLRCKPSVLEGRLAARGYPEGKVRENLEAEALNIIRDEYLELLEFPGEYHEGFLSIFRPKETGENTDPTTDCYLTAPAFSGAGSELFRALAKRPLLELDTSRTDIFGLAALVKTLLVLRLEAAREIETLKTKNGAPLYSSGEPEEEGETLLSQLSQPDILSETHRLPGGYVVGLIDWSSEILTWY